MHAEDDDTLNKFDVGNDVEKSRDAHYNHSDEEEGYRNHRRHHSSSRNKKKKTRSRKVEDVDRDDKMYEVDDYNLNKFYAGNDVENPRDVHCNHSDEEEHYRNHKRRHSSSRNNKKKKTRSRKVEDESDDDSQDRDRDRDRDHQHHRHKKKSKTPKKGKYQSSPSTESSGKKVDRDNDNHHRNRKKTEQETAGKKKSSTTSSDSINPSSNQDDDWYSSAYMLYGLVFALVVLVVIGILIGIVIIGKNKNSNDELNSPIPVVVTPSPTTTLVPTTAPTMSAAPTLPRFEALLERLGDILPEEDMFMQYENITDPSLLSPQYRAFQWLANDDPANLPLDTTDFTTLLQRYVMGIFYYSTNGESWDEQIRFLSGESVCSWRSGASFAIRGIICQQTGIISQVRFIDRGIEGTIPSELGLLSDLSQLILSRNLLEGTIPSSLGGLTNLNRLSLNGNQLVGPIPASLGSLNAETVILHTNSITDSSVEDVFCDGTTRVGNLMQLEADCLDGIPASCSCCTICL